MFLYYKEITNLSFNINYEKNNLGITNNYKKVVKSVPLSYTVSV